MTNRLSFEVFMFRAVCILGVASVFVDSNCYALVLSSMSYNRKMNCLHVYLLTF